MTCIDESKEYIKYARDILDGKELACKNIKLACKRFIDWFSRDDIFFDFADVDSKIRFISKFKLTEDPYTGLPFNLLPYQQWIFANIYGWKYVGTDRRVTRNALLLMARKQGKTQLAAGLMLASIVGDMKHHVDGFVISNSSDQAKIAFDHVFNLCKSIDPGQKLFFHGKGKFVKKITIPLLDDSQIRVLSSDTQKLDGLNPQVFIQDEAHAAKSDNVFHVLKTGQGARHNPLAICISTTGFLVGDDYPLYAQWHTCKDILEGVLEDDSWFSALYQLDDADDWHDKTLWKKACPSLGVTVPLDSIEADYKNAVNNPSTETQFKTKQLNMWCSSSSTWITQEEIKTVTQPFDLQLLRSKYGVKFCIVGVDLATRSDLCVLTTLCNVNNIWYFKAFPFCCERALERSKNKDLYRRWIDNGYLELIKGDSIDLDIVLEKLAWINKQCPIALVAYDSWGADHFISKCKNAGVPIMPIHQDFKTMNGLVDEFEHRLLTKQMIIDDSPVTRWCFSNVVMLHTQEMRKPDKQTQANKIDVVIGFLQSIKLMIDMEGRNKKIEAVLL